MVLVQEETDLEEEEIKKKRAVLHKVHGSHVAICLGSGVPSERSCVGMKEMMIRSPAVSNSRTRHPSAQSRR